MLSEIIREKKQKKMESQVGEKIIRIADFCKKKNVSQSFVYKYIRKEKIRVIDLPVYVSFQGQLIKIGTERFIDLVNSEYK